MRSLDSNLVFGNKAFNISCHMTSQNLQPYDHMLVHSILKHNSRIFNPKTFLEIVCTKFQNRTTQKTATNHVIHMK